MILALDISTSCTGWCVFDENELKGSGYINLSKHKGMYEKAGKVKTELLYLTDLYPFTKVVVEENLQAFRPGLSSAKTLMTLAQFNGVVRWICHADLNSEVEFPSTSFSGFNTPFEIKCCFSSSVKLSTPVV